MNSYTVEITFKTTWDVQYRFYYTYQAKSDISVNDIDDIIKKAIGEKYTLQEYRHVEATKTEGIDENKIEFITIEWLTFIRSIHDYDNSKSLSDNISAAKEKAKKKAYESAMGTLVRPYLTRIEYGILHRLFPNENSTKNIAQIEIPLFDENGHIVIEE